MRGGRGRLGRGLIFRSTATSTTTSTIPAIVTSPNGLMSNIGGDGDTRFVQATAVASGSFTNLYARLTDRYGAASTDHTFDLRLIVDGVPLNQMTVVHPSVFTSIGSVRWYGATTITTPADGVHPIEMYLVSAPVSTLRCEANYFVVGTAPSVLPSYNVPALGNAVQSNRWRNGLVDYVTWPGGNTRPVGVSVPRSVVTTIGITSAGVVSASDWRSTNKWYQEAGNHVGVGLYQGEMDWRIVNNGWVGIEQNLWQGGDSATAATPGQLKKALYNGGRLCNQISGYSTLRWTSTLKAWVISLTGELAYVDFSTGEKVGVAGRVYKTSTIALHEDNYTEAQISAANFEYIGSAASIGLLKWNAPHDAYPYPGDENTVVVADSFNHRLLKVNTSVVPATVSLLVGRNGKGCVEGDVSVSAKINRPYAIWIHPDHRVFFCCTPSSVGEASDSAIFELSADETTLRKVVGFGTSANDPAGVYRPFWMCEFTSGNVLSLEHVTGVIKKTNYETGVTSVWTSNGHALPDGWEQIVCDTVGAIGPRYDVFVVPANSGPGNISIYRYDVSASAMSEEWMQNSTGVAPTGPAESAFESHGHYPWFFDIHRRYALVATQGFGNTAPNLVRAKVSADKTHTYNHILYRTGEGILQYGTLPGFPVVARPSFTCLRSAFGHSFIAGIPSWTELVATKTSASIVAYLAAGAGGTVPRPEIAGYWGNLAMYAMNYMGDANVTVVPPSQPSSAFPAITAWQSSRSGTDLTVEATFSKPVFACLCDFLKATMADGYSTSHTLTLAEAGPDYVMRFADADGHVCQTVTVS